MRSILDSAGRTASQDESSEKNHTAGAYYRSTREAIPPQDVDPAEKVKRSAIKESA
jgi:hypothetical protein